METVNDKECRRNDRIKTYGTSGRNNRRFHTGLYERRIRYGDGVVPGTRSEDHECVSALKQRNLCIRKKPVFVAQWPDWVGDDCR